MKAIPLFGTGLKSYSQVASAQRRLNCFYDIRPDQDGSPIIVRGTPGSVLVATLPPGFNPHPIWGWRVVNGYLFVVAGQYLFRLDQGLRPLTVGQLPTVAGPVEMSDNGIHLGIVDGVAGYSVTLDSLTIATIGGSFPAGSSSITCLDSFAVAVEPLSRSFFVSSVLDLTTAGWSQPIKGTKENTSDYLIAVDALNGLLILWGSASIEFWQDLGTAPNPFSRINGASQTWGLAAVRSRANIANTMIFLGQNPQGGAQVLMLQGYVPVRVSTSDIESMINDFGTLADAVAMTYLQDGHMMYQITFPSQNVSLLYDATTQFWSEVQTGLALQDRHYGQIGVAFGGKNYFADATNPNIYRFDIHTNTDNGFPIKRQVCSRHIRQNGNEFGIGEVYLDMETGVGTNLGQGQDPLIVMQVSKDNGRTFGPERPKRLGRAGQYKTPRAKWDRLGSAKDFVLRWTMTDPVDFVIVHGAGQPIPGTEMDE